MKINSLIAFLLSSLSVGAFGCSGNVPCTPVFDDVKSNDLNNCTDSNSCNIATKNGVIIDNKQINTTIAPNSNSDPYDWSQNTDIPKQVRAYIEQEMAKKIQDASPADGSGGKATVPYLVEKYRELKRCIEGNCEVGNKRSESKQRSNLSNLALANFKELEKSFLKDTSPKGFYIMASLQDMQMDDASEVSAAYQNLLNRNAIDPYYILGSINYLSKVDIEVVKDIIGRKIKSQNGKFNSSLLSQQYKKNYYKVFHALADIYKGELLKISDGTKLNKDESEAFDSAVDLYKLMEDFNNRLENKSRLDNIEVYKSLEDLHRKRSWNADADRFAEKRTRLQEEASKLLEANILLQIRGMELEAKQLEKNGHYDKAEKVYNNIIAVHRQVGVINTVEVADALNNLGVLYSRKREYLNAETLFQRALAINKKRLGNNNSTLSVDYRRLALIYDEQQKYKEAEVYYRMSLDIEYRNKYKDGKVVSSAINSMKDSLKKIYLIQGEGGKVDSLDKDYPNK